MNDISNLTNSQDAVGSAPQIPSINTYGLTDLGYKIFLDRYAYKDMSRESLAVGDIVIAILQNESDMNGRREVSVVTELDDRFATIMTMHGEEQQIKRELCDKPVEVDPAQLQARVARGIASVEGDEEGRKLWEANFKWLLDDWKFVPGGRILTAAGTDQNLSSYNCFVLNSPEDSREGIFKSLSEMAEVMSRGGGVGLNTSSLRPRHSYVKGVNGRSSGAVSWGALFSYVTGLIEQAGSRRGALILILNDTHPDVYEFINSKRTMGQITNANISVGISDRFMEAVKNDEDWTFQFPDTQFEKFDEEWDGDLEAWADKGYPVVDYDTVSAREMWHTIIESAWDSAEPGLWFRERSNKMSNSYYYEEGKLIATNPCVVGETLVPTDKGYKRTDELKVGDNIKTPNGYHPIERIDRNGIKEIWRVEFDDGGHLDATADHGLLVVSDINKDRENKGYPNWTDNGVWIAVENLKIGDVVGKADDETAVVKAFYKTNREEEVYDVFEPVTLTWITNGYISLDCGEIPLPGNGVCNLGALNFGKFAMEPFSESGLENVDWDTLGQTVRYATRFLDNVIDYTYYVTPENEVQQKNERRLGLGSMGIAELMLRCGIRYGSEEAVNFTDKLYEFVARESYLMSAEIAAEKGPFPKFDSDKFMNSGHMLTMPEDVRDKASRGMRNVVILTIQPTGCVVPDTLISTGSGLSPISAMGKTDGQKWQSITNSVMTDEGEKFADKFYINGVQETIRIETSRGFSIEATPNHQIRIIDDNGDYVWKHFYEIEHEDTVVLWRDTATVGELQPLMSETLVSHFNTATFAPTHMTTELAELVGLYMGDGYLKESSGLGLVVGDNSPDLIDHIKSLASKLFDANTYVAKKDGCSVVMINSRNIYRLFHENGMAKPKGNFGEGAAGAFIPDVVLRSGRDIIAAFLRGLFEADGGIHRQTVNLHSVSERLIRQVQVALLSLNVASTIRVKRRDEATNAFGGRDIFEVRAINRNEVINFREAIGFISTRKREMLQHIGSFSRGDAIWNRSAIESVYRASEGYPDEIRQEIAGRVRNKSLNVEYVRQVAQKVPEVSETTIGQLAIAGAFFDRVESIDTGLSSMTYDISVPENNTYIANGFVSHNTTGTMMNTSTGIEPYFSWKWYRQGRLGFHEENAAIVQEYLKHHGIILKEGEVAADRLPAFFATAMDLTPFEHVAVMAAAQRWIGSAISKTVNAPNDYTVEQTAELYMHMYDLGVKGGTIYRDGSRDLQVLHRADDDTDSGTSVDNVDISGHIHSEEPNIVVDHDKRCLMVGESCLTFEYLEAVLGISIDDEPFSLEDEVRRAVDSDTSALEDIIRVHEAREHVLRMPKRPDILVGPTFRTVTPVGTAFVTVNEDENGNPFEIFVTIGKAGSDVSSQAESLARLVSVSLQMHPAPLRRDVLKVLVDQIVGIGGARSLGFGANRVLSLPDAVGQVIRKNYIERPAEGEERSQNSIQIKSEQVYSFTADNRDQIQSIDVMDKHEVNGLIIESPATRVNLGAEAELCPECGNMSLVRQDGCKKCFLCGYSEC